MSTFELSPPLSQAMQEGRATQEGRHELPASLNSDRWKTFLALASREEGGIEKRG